MKKSILIITALSMTQGVFAQSVPGVTPGLGGVIVQQPGVYDQQKLDRTAIIMQSMSTVDVENKLLVAGIIKSGMDAVEVLRQVVNGGNGRRSLRDIERDGFAAEPKFLDVSEFLEIRGIMNDNISRAQQAVDTLTTVATKDNKTTITIEGKIIELPARASQTIGEEVRILNKAIADVDAQASAMNFRVVGGGNQDGVPYNLTLKGSIPAILLDIAGRKLAEMREKAEYKVNKDPLSKKAKDKVLGSQRALNKEFRDRIDAVIAVMGKGKVGEIWNLNKGGMATALENLQEIMIARTVLRYSFGVPIGALGVDYETYWLNLDQIGLGNQIKFLPNDIYGMPALIKVQNSNKLQYEKAQKKSQEVFGKGVPLLSRILSGINVITLRVAWGQVNTYIMDLLVQDIEQDIMMNSALGKEKLEESIATRKQANPEWAKENNPSLAIFEEAIDSPQANAAISSSDFSRLFQSAVSSLQGWQDIWTDYVVTIKSINDQSAGRKALAGAKKRVKLSEIK